MQQIGLALSALAGVGTLALAIQWAVLLLHRRTPPRPRPLHLPKISVLKPLCGLDEDLQGNLETFSRLHYPSDRFEVLLGVRDRLDAAYPIAQEMVRRHPATYRCVLQEGEPGLNPKVNQLITLAERAKFDLLVVSDSNVCVPPEYLEDIAAHFVDPSVGCVTHPVAGRGQKSWGALIDNLHLGSSVAPGMVAAQRIGGRDLVVGKSMALWRHDLLALGGFDSVKDHLAEDHVLGKRVSTELHKRVVISSLPVYNVASQKSVGDFFRRYRRWAVIHRTAVAPTTYLAQALLNPVPLALAGWALSQSRQALMLLWGVGFLKVALDLSCSTLLGIPWMRRRALPAILLKDTLLFFAWTYGLFVRTVNWRGNRLRVTTGSRLVPRNAISSPTARPLPS
jgi:ceramide glucosyltransferase